MAIESPQGTGSEGQRSSAIEELSRLMLEGWTMLADICPTRDCHMPLARSRDGRIVCCACYTERPNGSHDPSNSVPATRAVLNIANGGRANRPATPAGADDRHVGPVADDLNADVGEEQSDARVSVRGPVSAVNGFAPEGAAEGALGESGVISRDGESEGRLRHAEPRDIQGTSAGDRQPAVPFADQTESRLTDAGSTRGRELAVQRRDIATAALGEKLLQGWTMLQDPCARCSTPLLRDNHGTLLCVTCTPSAQCGDGAGMDVSGLPRHRQGLDVPRQAQSEERNLSLPHPSVHGFSQPELNMRAQFHGRSQDQAGHTRVAPLRTTNVVSGPRGSLHGPTYPGYNLGVYSEFRLPTDRPLLQAPPTSHQLPPPADPPAAPSGTTRNDVGNEDGMSPGLIVGWELVETELAIAEALRVLRSRLHAARDVESVRASCAAIQAAADAITSLRQAASSVS